MSPPNETDPLLQFTTTSSSSAERVNHPTIEIENDTDCTVVSVNEHDHVGRHNGSVTADISCTKLNKKCHCHQVPALYTAIVGMSFLIGLVVAWRAYRTHLDGQTRSSTSNNLAAIGPYTTIREVQEGSDFWSYYDFYEGNDTLGSAGYNTYVNHVLRFYNRISYKRYRYLPLQLQLQQAQRLRLLAKVTRIPVG
jgi:hypothetical protein